MVAIAATLNATQIGEAQKQAQSIANAAQQGAGGRAN